MRIALAHPSYWPEVRRGSERLVHDLAGVLSARGHDVTLLTSHPGPRAVADEEGVRVVRRRRPRRRRPLERFEDHLESAPGIAWEARRGGYDLVHAFHPSYAWAATRLRRLGGPPVVFSLHGVPERGYLDGRSGRLRMLRATIRGAAATSVLSESSACELERNLGVRPLVLPGGVLAERFDAAAERARTPTIVCAASLGDRRKRAGLLFGAFSRLRRERPDARLVLVRVADPHLSGEVPPLPDGAEWITADRTEELGAAYASAWASVLPSASEAFGLVLVESLAAGTPVVAARSGAGSEIVSSEAVGRLFEPDDEASLTRALGEALDLGGAGGTATACRAAAAPFDWSRVGDAYERAYVGLLR